MNKYLVTGASGFVGAYIVRRLHDSGEKVAVLTRNRKNLKRIQDIIDEIEIVESDLLDKRLYVKIRKVNANCVFHLAAYGSLPHEDDLGKLLDINVMGTVNLVRSLKDTPLKLMVNTGSSSEYGLKNERMSESDTANPNNDYGISKLAQTLYMSNIASRENLPIITFRLFSVYGPGEYLNLATKNRLVPYVIYSAIKNKDLYLASANFVRDYIYLEDVFNAFMKAVKVKTKPGEIFNIGTGKDTKTKDLVSQILKLTGSKSTVHWGTVKKHGRQVEPKMWRADTRKSEKTLRWKADYSLTEGLQNTIDWFLKNPNYYKDLNKTS